MSPPSRQPPPELVVVDIETTGLDPDDRIIEVAALKVDERLRLVDTFATLVDPGVPLPLAAERRTGITAADLEGAPPFAEVYPAFLEFVGGGAARRPQHRRLRSAPPLGRGAQRRPRTAGQRHHRHATGRPAPLPRARPPRAACARRPPGPRAADAPRPARRRGDPRRRSRRSAGVRPASPRPSGASSRPPASPR